MPFVMTAATVEKTFSAGEALYANTVAAARTIRSFPPRTWGHVTWIAAVDKRAFSAPSSARTSRRGSCAPRLEGTCA
jgi:hypothetical protein